VFEEVEGNEKEVEPSDDKAGKVVFIVKVVSIGFVAEIKTEELMDNISFVDDSVDLEERKRDTSWGISSLGGQI
jgi:hypothetical protein